MLTSIRYLFAKMSGSIDKESYSIQLDNIYRLMKLNTVLDQLLYCFEDGPSVKSAVGKDLLSSFSTCIRCVHDFITAAMGLITA